jgi:nitrogen-specific signal transduction histidine kinase
MATRTARTRSRGGAEAALVHEIKNTLTATKAFVQLGLRNPAEGPSHARLAMLEREIARMQAILDGALSSARPGDEAEREPIELGHAASAR